MHHNRKHDLSIAPGLTALGLSLGCLGLWFSPPAGARPQPTIGSPANSPAGQLVLPPPEDISEEILRTEIIFEARSPLDGSSLSPADYAQLQAELAAPQTTLTLNSDIRYIIFLLQARRTFKPVIPFLP